MKAGEMPDDYREIDDRYDRMTRAVDQMHADRARQESLRGERPLYSAGSAAPPTFSGIFKTIIGCAILLVVLFVVVSIIGWAIATFVVK
jgi:hypothetical protein